LVGVALSSKEKILIKAKSMFAEKGFANVSMRNLAKAVGMSVASIYHHFPDKNTLYLETVQFSFKDKAMVFSEVWQENCSLEQKLELFVSSLVQVLTSDREFHRLIQREIVDANPERMKMLAEDVFKDQFNFLLTLMKQIAPAKDAHLSAISVLSLCKHHVEMQPLRRFLPEWKLEHEQPDVLAKHVMELLLNRLKESDL
jgi:AcrR family transcriptional regulator